VCAHMHVVYAWKVRDLKCVRSESVKTRVKWRDDGEDSIYIVYNSSIASSKETRIRNQRKNSPYSLFTLHSFYFSLLSSKWSFISFCLSPASLPKFDELAFFYLTFSHISMSSFITTIVCTRSILITYKFTFSPCFYICERMRT